MQQDDHRRTSRGLGWLFLAATVFQVLQSVAFDLLGQKGIEPPVEILLVFSELSILVPTLIYILIKKLGFREDLGFKKIKAGTFFMCILLTLLVMPVASFFNALSQLFVKNAMVQMSDQLLGGSGVAVLLLGAFYAPICEEFLCRSVFAKRYETVAGPLRAAFISAALFALMHMNINQAFYTFVLGVIFCVINKAAGSIYPSVIIHMGINGFNILLMFAMEKANRALGAEVDLITAAEAARESDMIYVMIGVTLVMAMICIAIAIPCVVFVAKHEDNLDELVGMFTKKHPSHGWISIPLVAGVCFVLFVMFGLGPLLGAIS